MVKAAVFSRREVILLPTHNHGKFSFDMNFQHQERLLEGLGGYGGDLPVGIYNLHGRKQQCTLSTLNTKEIEF